MLQVVFGILVVMPGLVVFTLFTSLGAEWSAATAKAAHKQGQGVIEKHTAALAAAQSGGGSTAKASAKAKVRPEAPQSEEERASHMHVEDLADGAAAARTPGKDGDASRSDDDPLSS